MAAVCVVCIGTVAGAVYDFYMLSHLRSEYLDKQGHEIASQIDALTRGPGRRDNPAVWQAEFEKAFEKNQQWLAFIVLLDNAGRALASTGELPPQAAALSPTETLASRAYITVDGAELFIFEARLPAPQHLPDGGPPGVVYWRLRMGLRTGPAGYIHKHAYAHLLIALAVVSVIGGLSFYFLRTLRRFLELQEREQSEKQLAALGRMAATLAHEIRNPLGAMKGLTQVVQEELPKDHATQPLMQTVVGEAERLERLVTDLLTFARAREPRISDFDLRELIASVAGVLQASFEQKRIAFSVVDESAGRRADLAVRSDEHGLRQVLLNVLLNAIDATPSGGRMTLTAHCDRPCRVLVMEVDDSGTGPGEGDVEELFQPFVTTKAQGTGLGLAVSRQIVEQLGGTITLANRAGGGARCTVRLPVACVELPAMTRPAPAASF